MAESTVTVVGGGIGGSTAAVALHQRGWRVEVLERAADVTEIHVFGHAVYDIPAYVCSRGAVLVHDVAAAPAPAAFRSRAWRLDWNPPATTEAVER